MSARICPICDKINNELTDNDETTHSRRPRARGQRKDT